MDGQTAFWLGIGNREEVGPELNPIGIFSEAVHFVLSITKYTANRTATT